MQTEQREKTILWVLRKAKSHVVLLLVALAIFAWLIMPKEEKREIINTQGVGVVSSPSTEVVQAEVSKVPNFVDMGTSGNVTLSAKDVELVRLQIVQTAELQPFLWGLTAQERSEVVEDIINAFNQALIRGGTRDRNLQRAELYKHGAALQAAADSGQLTAQEAINQYVAAFNDDLVFIGPENVGSPDLVLAIVGLDALGETEAASAYVAEVLEARESAKRIVDLVKGMGLKPESLPENLVVPEAGEAPEANSAPEDGDMPNAENDITTQGEPHQTGSFHVIPPVIPMQPPIKGLGLAPYNVVIFAQWAGRLILDGDNGLTDVYTVQQINIENIDLFGSRLYYVQMQIQRVRDSGETQSFPILVITGNVLQIEPGSRIDYKTLATLAEATVDYIGGTHE